MKIQMMLLREVSYVNSLKRACGIERIPWTRFVQISVSPSRRQRCDNLGC